MSVLFPGPSRHLKNELGRRGSGVVQAITLLSMKGGSACRIA